MRGSRSDREGLGKRARQVLDLLYRKGALSAAGVLEEIPDLPSYSAARAVLRTLEEKGLVTHAREESRYVYRPSVPTHRARRSAIRHVVDVFFSGSPVEAMAALVDLSSGELADEEVDELRRLIERAEGKP